MKNKCYGCRHWKFHSRHNDPEPQHSISFHYCEVLLRMSFYYNHCNTAFKERMKICEPMNLYEPKQNEEVNYE